MKHNSQIVSIEKWNAKLVKILENSEKTIIFLEKHKQDNIYGMLDFLEEEFYYIL